jgi:hypothetical protein
MKTKKLPSKTPWRPIKTCRVKDYQRVDLWMQWEANFTTLYTDSFRIPDCWREGEKWFHMRPKLKMHIAGKPGRGAIETVGFISVEDAHLRGGSVFIKEEAAELSQQYITHWMPVPKAPKK